MSRWMLAALAAFVAVYCITVVATGNPVYIIPAAVLAAIILAAAAANLLLTRRVVARHGSIEQAMADEDEPMPSTHAIPDDATPLGDTPEAHDELSPHDLPVDHPARREAERRAAEGRR